MNLADKNNGTSNILITIYVLYIGDIDKIKRGMYLPFVQNVSISILLSFKAEKRIQIECEICMTLEILSFSLFQQDGQVPFEGG